MNRGIMRTSIISIPGSMRWVINNDYFIGRNLSPGMGIAVQKEKRSRKYIREELKEKQHILTISSSDVN